MTAGRTGAVVLAAGAGTRFGSTPKQLALLDGRPLLQHVVDTAVAVDELDPIVVVLGAHEESIRDRIDFRRAKVVLALGWDEGMAASLRAGIAGVEEEAGAVDHVIVLLADQPRVRPDVIAEVLRVAREAPEGTAARAVYGDRPGHPVVLPSSVLGEIAALEGDAGAREVLERVPTLYVEADDLAGGADVDTPENLEALR